MKYSEYIKLGFERINMDDPIEFHNVGYYGFALEIRITEKIVISVRSGELNHPKLLIKKANEDRYVYYDITPESVVDLCSS